MTEAERICVEAERAYFACFPQPEITTTTKEESEAERLFRESWEREQRSGNPEKQKARR